jgi:hypothetical protein
MVRNGNGTKWLWYEMTCFEIHYDQFIPGDTKQSRLESTTEITQNKLVKVLHYFVDDIKGLKWTGNECLRCNSTVRPRQ